MDECGRSFWTAEAPGSQKGPLWALAKDEREARRVMTSVAARDGLTPDFSTLRAHDDS